MGIISDCIGNIAARGTNLVVAKAQNILKDRMKAGYKKILIKSSIKYVIIFIGVFLAIFQPFKFVISNLITSFLFIGVFIWSFISSMKVIKEFYKLPIFIFHEKSIHCGTWNFIKYKWPGVAKGIVGYNVIKTIGCCFSDNFKEMPEVEDTVKNFLKYLLKDFIIFISFFILYFITVNFIVKPFLLLHFAGIHTWEIYLFPFVQVKDFIVYLCLKIF